MTFQARELPQSATLGERLRQVRTDAGWTIEEAAKKTSIQAKYLTIIESGLYRQLPGPVYARSFVKRYALALGVQVEQVMELFDREYQIVTSGRVERHLPSERVSTEHHWVRRHARLLIAGGVISLVLVYLGFQVDRLITPPTLIISQPSADITTRDRQVTIKGSTDVTAGVTINNQAVALGSTGSFSEKIDLSPGLNTLTVVAQKKHSRPRTVIRNILVETENTTQ